ncbi:thiol-disulfide isomerase/thioredoxin [Streptomyces sp. CG 926]|uniref:TlpA family protein disulfide reductase n=1 Tax=Streptomyces sp. CG 926 TaxID=1882405 RepID=UPI000D6CE443|nr:TlpA disulfide reductase family protein [Streptomyces sp. CG 926]PWK65105.1 thiol-disulfide isomerase/thioredoxin [Streptomyces sp. CG 926]
MFQRSPSGRGGVSRRTALAGLAVLTVSAATGCGAGDDSGKPAAASADQRLTSTPAAERNPAPDISGETLTGEPVALADLRGKIVVLNVWGSWCAPCRAEAPHLQKVHTELRDQGVAFLGINTRDGSKEAARGFEETFSITYPSLWDPDGRELLKFKGTLPPSAIPTTLVIDRRGRVAARGLKALTEAELRSLIDPVLKEG